MIPDPTDEIREIKHRLGAEMGFDVHRIADDVRRRQRESGRKYVSLPPRRPASMTEDSHPLHRSPRWSIRCERRTVIDECTFAAAPAN
ncbi:hypothetical protein Pla100_34750 [Neorhodopirellula pilleata]|uniref:Uncharacterized protein n=1 Tax=Neorhodopirellula pilleata TaxID=2714738 RepID=A0A5C6A4S1_9BACT|nr:hypothetical protein Pla100_34750 [Neorhodopirellula pilleata]